tara:strand:+ start:1807 stop:2460 length:654 start_codon:yes stop_codon:yes gene_type:complete
MGQLDKARREAEKIIRQHRPNATRSEFRHSESTDALLRDLPVSVRKRVARPAIRAAAKVVRKKVRKNLYATGKRAENPDGTVVRGQPIGRSRKTKTYDKLSNKLKAKRSGNKEMAKAIISRNWSRNMNAVIGSTTGPSYRHAAQGHLLEYGANIMLWGGANKAKGGKTHYRLPPRPFMRNAVTQTRGLQKLVILSTMKKWAKLVGNEVARFPDIDDS